MFDWSLCCGDEVDSAWRTTTWAAKGELSKCWEAAGAPGQWALGPQPPPPPPPGSGHGQSSITHCGSAQQALGPNHFLRGGGWGKKSISHILYIIYIYWTIDIFAPLPVLTFLPPPPKILACETFFFGTRRQCVSSRFFNFYVPYPHAFSNLKKTKRVSIVPVV